MAPEESEPVEAREEVAKTEIDPGPLARESVRLPRQARVRIERDRDKRGARVLIDGVDVSSHVTAVTWAMQAGKLPTATITFHDVEVAVDAEGAGPETVDMRELAGRLRGAGFAKAADFFESVKPVEARERVINMDVVREHPVKRTPEQWCQQYGVDVYDPDGWRGKGDPTWNTPITLADFYQRAVRSTVRNAALVDWERIRRHARAT